MTYLDTRAFGVAPLPYYREPKPEPCEAKGCTEPVSGLTPAGAYACEFHVTTCDSDHAPIELSAAGFCRVCDASACTCTSDEFARPACAVHGKAV